MPAIYAHWLLGEKTLESSKIKEKDLILKNRKAFNLGLQGPDFMYFKDKGTDEEVSDFAGKLHNMPASYALTEFSKTYKASGNSASLAYILGFIGHFALDTNCHWYVYKVVDEDEVNHDELETEFDRFLMMKEGLRPAKVKVEEFISIDGLSLEYIIDLYETFGKISNRKLKKSFIDFYKFKKYIRMIQSGAPFLINSALKMLKREDLYGIFMRKELNTAIIEKYMVPMHENFNRALEIYPKLIENFINSLEGEDLNEYFARDFVRIGEKD